MIKLGGCRSWLDDQDVSFRTRAGLIRAWAVLAFALFVVSWRLWIAQSGYPQVPFLRITAQVPSAFEWLLFLGVLGSLVFVKKYKYFHKEPCNPIVFFYFGLKNIGFLLKSTKLKKKSIEPQTNRAKKAKTQKNCVDPKLP